MKKYIKFLLLFALVSVSLILFFECYAILKPKGYKRNPIRPEDFPEILIASDNAVMLDYAKPTNFSYRLSFVVHDPYPSSDTYNFLERHLRSKCWQRLNYDLLNPYNPNKLPARSPPKYLSKENINILVDEVIKNKKQRYFPKLIVKENWLCKNDEHIYLELYYLVDLDSGKVNQDKVHVSLHYHKPDSWQRPFILRYKELHPEEFEVAKEVNEPNNI